MKLYKIEAVFKGHKILWDFGEARGIEFGKYDIHVSGVGIEAYYPYKDMEELHITTKKIKREEFYHERKNSN